MIKSVLREPLVHFLFGGVLLYALYGAIGTPETKGQTIVVDRPALLNYLQYKYKTFQPEIFSSWLDGMPKSDLDKLARDYVDQEILYREARSYTLEEGDDVIRQRLIQKAKFLLDNEAVDQPPSDRELRAYFARHSAQYVVPPSITFTHVFFDNAIHGSRTEQIARNAVHELNAHHVTFSDAPAYGDRFPFLLNYVNKAQDFVAAQLGADMTSKLMSLQPSETEWRGPYRSAEGWHAVLLTQNNRAKPLRFDQVRDDVREMFLEERRDQRRARALERLRAQYQIKVELPHGPNSNAS